MRPFKSVSFHKWQSFSLPCWSEISFKADEKNCSESKSGLGEVVKKKAENLFKKYVNFDVRAKLFIRPEMNVGV